MLLLTLDILSAHSYWLLFTGVQLTHGLAIVINGLSMLGNFTNDLKYMDTCKKDFGVDLGLGVAIGAITFGWALYDSSETCKLIIFSIAILAELFLMLVFGMHVQFGIDMHSHLSPNEYKSLAGRDQKMK